MVTYRFKQWENGDTNPTRILLIEGFNFTIQAVYEPVERTVTFQSTPIQVTATVNGQSLNSGDSLLIPDGTQITISVPQEVQV